MKKSFDLANHLMGTYTRLTNTIRYSTHPKIAPENVASHSFFVSYITMMLCNIVPAKVNKERAISMALIHDVEESLTGDIIYNIKHHNEEFSTAVENLNKTIIREIYCEKNELLDLWDEYKNAKTIEAKIVEAADRMSSVLYCINELRLGNNSSKDILYKNIALIKTLSISEISKLADELGKLELENF